MDFGGGAVGDVEEIGEGFVAAAGVAFGDVAHYGDGGAADLVFKDEFCLKPWILLFVLLRKPNELPGPQHYKPGL